VRFLLGGRVRLIALLAVAFAAVAALPAAAKVPGSNGRIVFARVVNPDTRDSITYTANPDGSHMQQLFSADFSGNPRWSPDGSRVAVLSAAGKPCCTVASVIVNPDDGSYQVLQMPDPTVFTACWVWSPDAKRLACDGESDSDPSRNGIYTIRTSDGGGLTRITNAGAGGGVDVIDVPIDYSPDGEQIVFGHIVFSHASPGHACSALYVVNVSGSDPQRITPCRFVDDDGIWSPDGTRIVFEHFGSLYTVHPDGTGLVKIPLQTGSATTAFTAFDAAWSPDGTKLVFSVNTKTSSGGTQEGIGTANADGSNVQVVTVSPTRDHQADWGPHPLVK
jgi:Tol biopolymer transport system component